MGRNINVLDVQPICATHQMGDISPRTHDHACHSQYGGDVHARSIKSACLLISTVQYTLINSKRAESVELGVLLH